MFPSAEALPVPGPTMGHAFSSAQGDRELILGTLSGSQEAFQRLVERHQRRVFRLLQRFTRDDTEDLAQEVFLKAYRRLHTFHFDSAFYTWLYRIAVNTATDYLERRRRSPVQAVESPEMYEKGAGGTASAPDVPTLHRELREVARDVLDRLPSKYRLILVLREYEELSYEEIASTLRCALGTVESRLFRARERFRELLERHYPDYCPARQGGERRDS